MNSILQINGVPGIKMYLKDTNEEVDFWGDDKYDDLVDFIEKTIKKQKNKKEL